MAEFTDQNGRKWSLNLTVSSVKRVLEHTGVNLTELTVDELQPLRSLLANPIKFADVVYWICKRQADEASIDDEKFFDGIAGETLVEIVEPFVEAIADFFQPRQKQVLVKLVRKIIHATNLLAGIADKELDKVEDQMLINAALNSQES